MGKKILIIDDDEDILEFLEMEISELGFEVHAASGGKEGIQKFNKVDPNLVLCDYVMPDVGGLEVLTKIRGKGRTPVLILSGHMSSETAKRLIKAGAQDVLEKPVDLTLLRMRVKSAAS